MAAMLICVIDDNPDDRELVRKHARDIFPDAEIQDFTEADAFAKALSDTAREPALVVTDYQLKWSDGIEVLRRSKARFPECPVIMFTGSGSEEVAVEAMKSGLDDYVIKSARHFAQLRSSIRTVVENARQRRTIRETEAQLRQALRQKDLLLQELNHRTKNNLLTVMSLMKLRARRSENPEVKELLTELAGRVQSLAQVQSRILASEDLDRVDFAAYLADIAAALHRMYGNAHVALRLDLANQLALPVPRAGPLALLVYELILNAFKHGFPEGRGGEVLVATAEEGGGKVIVVEDSGIGFEPGEGGLGMTLIGELVLEAEAEIAWSRRAGGGTRAEVRLRPEGAEADAP
jgi:two-component sensor histidine kinase